MSVRNESRNVVQAVRIPPAHEGIGRALRSIYAGGQQTLPQDFNDLLDRLT